MKGWGFATGSRPQTQVCPRSCCHVWENSANFQVGAFCQSLQLYHSRVKVDTHPFQSCWGQTQLRTKNLNTFFQRYTIMHMPPFSTVLYCWGGFQTACHVSHTLGDAHWWRKGLFISLLNKWPHTAQFFIFGYQWYVFPQCVRLNGTQSSLCTVMGNQQLEWNALISMNNLSDLDRRYGWQALRQRNLSCLHRR